MDFFGLLTMLGGLALFLYGMQVLGDGLSKLSGGRLEHILESLTSNRFKAVLLGAGVTAVIQSSSATTVMVVGFVNSGIMKLSQAIGIIMGANIGTTMTSWILSLAGIQGGNFFIKLLKPTSFSPVLALIGVIILMSSKKDKKRDIAQILIGFAVLMTGMDTMSGAVKPLADVPEFTGLFMHFTNPILGLLAGTFLTAIIQSSSASVGILQALCMTGAVSYGAALPIIMGQNIGTCVTAMISSIGTSKNAKRAALVHLYFNIIGTVVFMAVFYFINAFVHFSFLSNSANAAGIALIHTTFNIVATLLLLPFANVLEKLACLTVRDDKEEETLDEVEQDVKALDVRFLDQPSLALEHCKSVTYKMAEQAQKAVELSAGLLFSYDSITAENVIKLETNVDRYEDALGDYLVKLSSRHLSEMDSQTLSILLHCIGDFERIADHAVNICEYVETMQSKEQKFSQKAEEELQIYVKAICHIVDITVKVLEKEDLVLALQVEPLEDVIDSLNAEIKKRHIKRLRKGKCTVELGFCLSDIITSLERISDHCENVAISVLQSKDDSFEVHEYKDQLREDYKDIFEQQYKKFHEQYLLPEKKKATMNNI